MAPVTRRSGTSIRGEHASRAGNKKLKPAAGKRHNQALIALARRRSDVLFAMLRGGTLSQDPEPQNLADTA